nr:MAG: DUF4440 domain-containing protein [Pseudomonadota bacterium]
MGKGFPTAQDAEAAFYEAFETGDLEAMMNVWAEDEEIVCVHPGEARLVGYEQVRRSYAEMFKDRPRPQVHLGNQVCVQGVLLAVHSVYEHILVAGETKARPPILATNVYTRTGTGWRMLMHHASADPVRRADPLVEMLKILH